MSKPVLMTVDDDPGVSRAVARDLRRRYGEDFRIVRAESGPTALEALRELSLRGEPVAAILADHRMPEMNGVEFLEHAMDITPHARRALLTAYADTDAAIRAINVVDVDHYLLKPWDPPEEKLYPVVDALHRDLAHGRGAPGRGRAGGRAQVVGRVVRRPRLPGAQRGAVPLVLGRRGGGPAAAGRGGGRGGQAPRGRHRRGGRAAGAHRGRDRGGRRADHPADHRLLRPDRDRGWARGPRGRRVRGVGGPADRAGRAAGDRRSGRAELADRELPGLPRRSVRGAAHRPGPAPGGEVRRRGADDARRGRAGGAGLGAGRPVRRRRARSPRTAWCWRPGCRTGRCRRRASRS